MIYYLLCTFNVYPKDPRPLSSHLNPLMLCKGGHPPRVPPPPRPSVHSQLMFNFVLSISSFPSSTSSTNLGCVSFAPFFAFCINSSLADHLRSPFVSIHNISAVYILPRYVCPSVRIKQLRTNCTEPISALPHTWFFFFAWQTALKEHKIQKVQTYVGVWSL